MEMVRKYRGWKTIFPAFAVLLALATAPSSAFSFKSLFEDPTASQTTSRVSAEANSNSDSGSADLSDGSDIKPRQPLLAPKDWFLTEEEITASRGGVPRSDMAVYTTGNKVTTYTVSNEYFNAVYDDLSRTTEGNRVLLNAWTTALIPLKPDVDPTGAKTGFKEVFSGVVERGGNVNILGWANIAGGYMPYNIKTRNAINKIPPSPINGAKAIYIFDDRVKLISSQHQKNMVILGNSSGENYQPVAYVGGIDLANDRWDTIYHNDTAIRDAGHITYQQKGWVDGHIRIHGPAAKDVASNFVARWNSKFLPCQNLKEHLLDFNNPPYEDIPQLDYTSSKTTKRPDHTNLQLRVQTLQGVRPERRNFAVQGAPQSHQERQELHLH